MEGLEREGSYVSSRTTTTHNLTLKRSSKDTPAEILLFMGKNVQAIHDCNHHCFPQEILMGEALCPAEGWGVGGAART